MDYWDMAKLPPEHRDAFITREELHRLVWAEPVVRVARRFGVSDVAVAKWCRKLNVPVPGRGYWARLQAGQKLKKTPLPKRRKGEPKWIPRPRLVEPDQVESGDLSEEDIPPGFKNPIPITDDLRGAHPLVKSTKRAFAACEPGSDGIVRPLGLDCLNVCVSPHNLRRALVIMNSIVVAFESQGIQVRASSERGRMAQVTLDGIEMDFCLSEHTEKREREPTPKEERAMKRDYYLRGPFYEEVPTGRLCLAITSGYFKRCHQQSWSDGKRQRVEKCLYRFIKTMFRVAASTLRHQIAEEERRRKEEEQRQLERAARARRVEFAARERTLYQFAGEWEDSLRLAAFADALEDQVESDDAVIMSWIAWAKRYSKRLNPLRSSQHFIERLLEEMESNREKVTESRPSYYYRQECPLERARIAELSTYSQSWFVKPWWRDAK